MKSESKDTVIQKTVFFSDILQIVNISPAHKLRLVIQPQLVTKSYGRLITDLVSIIAKVLMISHQRVRLRKAWHRGTVYGRSIAS